jgi:HlyD family secretion protein
MKSITKVLALASVVAVMSLGAGQAMAQGRGNFDPAQMKQMRLDRLKDQMNVTDDAEWKVIETAAGKVMDAQMDAIAGRFGGMGRGGRGGAGGGTGGTNNAAGGQNGNRRGGGRFGTPSAEMEALQKAIDDNASTDVINSKLKALREATKAKEDKLEQAQADLQKLLTPRQEAVAVLAGVLK